MATSDNNPVASLGSHFLGAMGPFHLRLATTVAGITALSKVLRQLNQSKEHRESDGEPPAKKIRSSEESESETSISVARYECDVVSSLEQLSWLQRLIIAGRTNRRR
jgi:hypothetical protein